MNPPTRKSYIGDGVYADIERGMIKLTTEDGFPNDPSNTIYLEMEVYLALVRYVSNVHKSGGL